MPIGDFESGWENYDHTSGPALREEAKAVYKSGTAAPNWRLQLGTEDWTNRLVSGEVTFSKEGRRGYKVRSRRFLTSPSVRTCASQVLVRVWDEASSLLRGTPRRADRCCLGALLRGNRI